MDETEPPLMEMGRDGDSGHSHRGDDYSLEFLFGHNLRRRGAISSLLPILGDSNNSKLNNCCLRLVSRLANL